MRTKEKPRIKINFPLSEYFQQLFSSNIYVKFINPWRFWRRYRITHLDNCWSISMVQYLESCRNLELNPPEQEHNYAKGKHYFKSGKYRGIPWNKQPPSRIFMVQPPVELKYRGVTYYTGGVVILIHHHQAEIDSGLMITEQPATRSSLPKINNSETSDNISQS